MEHTTPDPLPERTPPPSDAVVLPEPRHEPPHAALPPLIGGVPAAGTLPPAAGRLIVPPRADATPWEPGDAWRPGGSVHGHDRAAGPAEPLVGVPSTSHTHRATTPAMRAVHDAGPVQKPQRRFLPIAAVGLAAGALGASLALGGAAVIGAFDDPPVETTPSTAPEIIRVTEIVPGSDVSPAAAVGLKVVPSIVTVETGSIDGDGIFRAFGSGSGVVLTADGRIATNHHVIDGADRVRVIFQDGHIYPAQIVGSDMLTDLAVLKIDGSTFVPIELGSAAALVIGDTAIAVGNPLGLSGGASLTAGVVSAFNREVQVGPTINDRLFGMVQTDAPITNGSSGGALVDKAGRLIGITTAIGLSEAGAEGIGFAIPVELVVRITDELAERGDVRHAFLGVGLNDFLEDDGPAQVPAGATIVSVEPGSGAAEWGLENGDRIIGLDGAAVRSNQDVINTLRLYRVGDMVSVEVVRNGESLRIDVELGERPEGI